MTKEELSNLFGLEATPYLRSSCWVELACKQSGKSKGFAFVNVPEHIAQELLKFNGIEFYGRPLNIEPAKSDPGDNKDEDKGKSKDKEGEDKEKDDKKKKEKSRVKTLREQISDNLECSICLDKFKDPKVLSCLHTFCLDCLKGLLPSDGGQSYVTCPVCRTETQVSCIIVSAV